MTCRLLCLLLLLVALPMVTEAEEPEHFGAAFSLEYVADSHENRCELHLEVDAAAEGSAVFKCTRRNWNPASYEVSRSLSQTEIGEVRVLLQKAKLFEGQYWGADARGLDFPLVTLQVSAPTVAVLVTSFNDSFDEGTRKALLNYLDQIEKSLENPQRGQR